MVSSISNNSNTYPGPFVDQARLEYERLYAQFMKDSKDPHADPMKVQEDIQNLLAFLNDPNNVHLLRIFAQEAGFPFTVSEFNHAIDAAKKALEDYTPDHPDQAWEYLTDMNAWTRYQP